MRSNSQLRGAKPEGRAIGFCIGGLALAIALALAAVAYGARPERCLAHASLHDINGKSIGTVSLDQQSTGTLVTAALHDLKPGVYAFHIHERGKCEPPFASAGGHYNPAGKEHGFFNPAGPHIGDLPNIVVVDEAGVGVQVFKSGLKVCSGSPRLLDDDGAAFVLHAGVDDYRTDPAGNAGERIACGVVAETSE